MSARLSLPMQHALLRMTPGVEQWVRNPTAASLVTRGLICQAPKRYGLYVLTPAGIAERERLLGQRGGVEP